MYGAIAGIVGGVGLGLSADRVIGIAGCRKLLLLGCCALGGVGFGLFALATTAGGLFETATDGARLVWIYVASVFGSLWCVTTSSAHLSPSELSARPSPLRSISLSLSAKPLALSTACLVWQVQRGDASLLRAGR